MPWDGAVGARHVVLCYALVQEHQPRVAVEPMLELDVDVGLVVAGVDLRADPASTLEVTKRLGRAAEQQAGLAAVVPSHPQTQFAPPLQRVLGRRVAHVAAPTAHELPWLAVAVGVLGQCVHSAADRVRAVEHRTRPLDHFQPLQRERIDRVPVLVRTRPEHRVVEPNPVDQEQVAEAGEPADVGRAVPVRGLLHHDTGHVAQDLRCRSVGRSAQLVGRDGLRRIRHVERILASARRRHDHRLGGGLVRLWVMVGILCGEDGGGEKKGRNKGHRAGERGWSGWVQMRSASCRAADCVPLASCNR